MPVLGKPRWAGGQVPRVALRPAASPGTRRADAVHQAPRAGQQRRAGPRCQHSFGDARAKHTVPTWRSAQSGPLAWTAGGGLRRGAWEPGRTWTIAAWRRPAPPASLLASLWASASTVGSAARSRSWKAGCERAAGRQVTRWLLRYKDESRVKRKRVTTPIGSVTRAASGACRLSPLAASCWPHARSSSTIFLMVSAGSRPSVRRAGLSWAAGTNTMVGRP